MKTIHLSIIIGSGITIVIVGTLLILVLLQYTPIKPERCDYYPNTTICRGTSMNIDGINRDYDEAPVFNDLNRPVEFDDIKFVYTGSSTPQNDNIDCSTDFPRAINVTFGHHPAIIVQYGGYYKVNETRHFTATFPNGKTKYLTLCWAQFTNPKIITMVETLGGSPIFEGGKINWFDDNKTAAIVQHRYRADPQYYNTYIAEVLH